MCAPSVHSLLNYSNAMKKSILFSLFAFALLCMHVGCSNKPKPTPAQEFRAELTAEDTTKMLGICEECMKTLKAGNIDGALNLLYQYDDSTKTVSPISEENRKKMRNTFTVFPVLNYRMVYYNFTTQGLNDVKYEIEFFEKADSTDQAPNTIGLMFNPVKVDDQWYLTMKEAGQDFTRTRN